MKAITTASSFIEFWQSNKSLTHKYVNTLLKVKPFDVTLRDGLQGLSLDEQKKYVSDYKKKMYQEIIDKHNPTNLEVGSCVNTNLLPIFKDTKFLLNSIKDSKNKYILVPNQEQLEIALNFGATNLSFIASISNSFQLKNTKLTKLQNATNLNNMLRLVDEYSLHKKCFQYNTKVYLSCINECPIEGKISMDDIFSELIYLKKMRFDKICLSDTCGSLTNKDFTYIVSRIYEMGIDIEKISLHLHVNPEKENESQDIVHTALDYGIKEFDVSYLNTGGCSVTMDKHKMAPNMSYEQYYKFLSNYLLKY
jgi:isopropylmalate/homocitrate/citramalate synthase